MDKEGSYFTDVGGNGKESEERNPFEGNFWPFLFVLQFLDVAAFSQVNKLFCAGFEGT